MERHEIVPDERIEPLIDAVERGDEVVFMREGKATARLTAIAALSNAKPMSRVAVEDMLDIWDRLPGPPVDASRLIREMRDEGY